MRQRFIFLGLSILGVLLIVFFGIRALHAFRKFEGHPPPPPIADKLETDVNEIEDWMTIPFISRSYGVPPDVLFNALGISDQGNHKKSLKQLNDEYFSGQSGYVLKTIQAAVLTHQPPTVVVPPSTAIPPQTVLPPNAPTP